VLLVRVRGFNLYSFEGSGLRSNHEITRNTRKSQLLLKAIGFLENPLKEFFNEY